VLQIDTTILIKLNIKNLTCITVVIIKTNGSKTLKVTKNEPGIHGLQADTGKETKKRFRNKQRNYKTTPLHPFGYRSHCGQSPRE